jgi:hypothetical protein
MPAVLTNDGAEALALVAYGKRAFSALTVGLFCNQHTPAVTDTYSDYVPSPLTSEQPIDAATWNGAAANGAWTGSCAPLTFRLSPHTGGQFIYGYYVRDQSNRIIWAEAYTTPYPVPTGGTFWAVAPLSTAHEC